jgi:hypothetical protein
MRSFALTLVAVLGFYGCKSDSTLSPAAPFSGSLASANAPVSSPFRLEFDDVNPCTGALEHFVFEGTQRAQVFDDHSILHIAGTVNTSTGWAGKFNRQLVTQGTDLTWRFMDMEVGPEGDRQIFNGVLIGTIVDGRLNLSFDHADLRCVGKPAA